MLRIRYGYVTFFLCTNNMDQNSLPNIQPMNIMCSYRHRNGEMCRTRSFTPRCAAHTGRQTHALCIICSVNFTSSKYMICSDIDCLSVRDSYRAQLRARRSYYDAKFVRECSEYFPFSFLARANFPCSFEAK